MVEGKKSKYDTDPLDPDFVRRTEEIGGLTSEVTRGPQNNPARPHKEASEEPTRRLEQPLPTSYPSVFVPPAYQPPPPASYTTFDAPAAPPALQTTAPPPPAVTPRPGGASGQQQQQQRARPSSRHVAGLGLPENVAHALPYAPFYIGLVAALIELLLVPRSEVRTRSHAAQGLALQLTILVISFLFGILGQLTGNGFGGWLFSTAAIVFLIVSMVRVWQGEEHRIAPLADISRRINQQFEPRN